MMRRKVSRFLEWGKVADGGTRRIQRITRKPSDPLRTSVTASVAFAYALNYFCFTGIAESGAARP